MGWLQGCTTLLETAAAVARSGRCDMESVKFRRQLLWVEEALVGVQVAVPPGGVSSAPFDILPAAMPLQKFQRWLQSQLGNSSDRWVF
jgi:hypothetical protein